ncbi:MAG: 23S rRNA (pseudouridine(1915)-N(3))-methyltransferase RlmH [Bacteroidia bacterium]|nr:23S rRNA (pseudouridine(1915)-N(3))-methyltransferase RlmH [Bacteroidia bacterium]
MKITLLVIGKTTFDFVKQGVNEYAERIGRYAPFSISVIEGLKKSQSLSDEQVKQKEGELILKQIKPTDTLILLDEKGKRFTSVGFSTQIAAWMQSGKDVVLVIGGAYGFSEAVYQRAQHKISLSDMTFSHQLIRVIFLEQLYRAFTILRGEPYHHE